MKLSNDFVEYEGLPDETECESDNCNNKAKDLPFYLTEWEIITGASTDGLYYCRECALAA